MLRPTSIVNFERCYLGAVVIGLLNSLFAVPAMMRTPQMAQASAVLGTGFIYITAILSLVISLLLWYFTARRASVVAKWIIVVFFVIGALAMIRNVLTGFQGLVGTLPAVLSIVAVVFQAVAVYLLFRPDANAWFAGRRTGADLGDTFR